MLTLTDADALLSSILANPADDAPRLVYADWLDENGQPDRASFIRVQCELARIGHNHPNLEWLKDNRDNNPCRQCSPLHDRERELWLLVGRAIADEASKAIGLRVTVAVNEVGGLAFWEGNTATWQAVVRRGFVAAVSLPLQTWIGGECGTCNGAGDVGTLGGRMGCPTCSTSHDRRGTGRTVGIGPTLARSQPVTAVRLVDREPRQSVKEDGRGLVWAWWREGNGGVPIACIPEPLWGCLLDVVESWRTIPRDRITVLDWPTRDEADVALSAACLALARG